MTATRKQSAPKPESKPEIYTVVEGDKLRAAVDFLKRKVVENTSTISVLHSIYVEARSGVLSLMATDLDVAARVELPCSGVGLHPILLDAKALSAVLSTTKGAEVLIDRQAKDVKLHVGARTFTLPSGGDPEEFPKVSLVPPSSSAPPAVAYDPVELDAALTFLLPACSTDVSRHNMSGIFHDGTILAATDTYRLHIADVGVKIERGKDESGILPAKAGEALRAAVRMVKVKDAEVRLVRVRDTRGTESAVSAFYTVCSSAKTDVIVRLRAREVEGTFPPVRNVIPKPATWSADEGVRVSVEGTPLAAALELAGKVSTEPMYKRVCLAVQGRELEVTAKSIETGGSFSEAVSAEIDRGNGKVLSCNGVYLQQAVEDIGGKLVQIEAKDDKTGPIMVTAPGTPERKGWLAILMPMTK